MEYQEFLVNKVFVAPASGFVVNESDLNQMLFPFQKKIVRWALRKGRAAIFADCGLGKSPMQLEWAHHVNVKTGKPILILAPLAVSIQTKREGEKFGIPVNICESQEDVISGINITNYEKLHKFDASVFAGVVLDESSILKNYSGKYRTEIINTFQSTPYKLACTATPAPNDLMELGNHSEFFNVMKREEMLAMFFYNDGKDTGKWHLKGHAEDKFWQWVASWSVYIRKPSDIGDSDDGFVLPEIRIKEIVIESDKASDSMLFSVEAQSLHERISARSQTVDVRSEAAAQLVNEIEPWLIWCNLNTESETAASLIPDAVEIRGSDSNEYKAENMMKFSTGENRVVVTKPSIAGFGMNWQHCNNVIFLGLSDSWEQYYQAVRRCWRFGQTKPVNVYIVITDKEGAVSKNIQRKERQAAEMAEKIVDMMKEEMNKNLENPDIVKISDIPRKEVSGESFKIILGDCVEETKSIPDESIDYTIFSPPFASLYTYSNSERDMGNCRDDDEFMVHFDFLVSELFRITKPGRNLSFHCMNLPMLKSKHGEIGIRDFRGELIKMFVSHGWIFHSEVCIWKDPVTAMQRTKAIGLLYKQLKKDSTISRQGIPDYLITMRKPGANQSPVSKTPDGFPVEQWQKWASPIWMDINQSNTLQKERDEKDEKHICPLQLDVIERGVVLWSNPGDTVFSPFTGIGSEGYQSIICGRKFIGIELKETYFNQAVMNLKLAEQRLKQKDNDLISMMEGEPA